MVRRARAPADRCPAPGSHLNKEPSHWCAAAHVQLEAAAHLNEGVRKVIELEGRLGQHAPPS